MLTGVLAGVGAGALWGLVFVAPRMVSGFSAVDLASGRFVAYGAVAVLVGVTARRPLPNASQALSAIGLSLLGFTGYYLLLVLAIRDAGTEVPTLIIGTIPIWVMLLGKPGHLRWGALVPGIVLTAAGLALMALSPRGAAGGAHGEHYVRGLLFAAASLASWTAFALLNSAWLKRHPEVRVTDWANWLGLATGAGAILLWLVAGSDASQLRAQPDLGLFAVLALATGAGSAWLATILWNVASRRLSASLCGQLIVSETLFALAYSFAWDGRWPTPAQAAAVVLFTLGILAAIHAHR
ncbi:DMT family transporter [Ramlibacter sp. USB13]|uniref:DMT family transporter n=1 Tax=Ramlibacter cellulosilyticus TaxID=2764187 RepID=A0A923SCG2_9BURK|nr:DMT family transporter [Ramlibacter cellulosilyticus]MBC5784931.1 DMT family transporter [Ramlibacter cellulosilyticus]